MSIFVLFALWGIDFSAYRRASVRVKRFRSHIVCRYTYIIESQCSLKIINNRECKITKAQLKTAILNTRIYILYISYYNIKKKNIRSTRLDFFSVKRVWYEFRSECMGIFSPRKQWFIVVFKFIVRVFQIF